MVDGTAARQTARDRDAMLFDIVCIDFFYGILIFANDDGIVVLPQVPDYNKDQSMGIL